MIGKRGKEGGRERNRLRSEKEIVFFYCFMGTFSSLLVL